MPNVKTVWVILRQRGAEEVKTQLEEVAAEARRLSEDDVNIKVKFDDGNVKPKLAALRIELAALKDAGNNAGLQDLAQRLRAVGDAAVSPKDKLSALRMAEDALGFAARHAGDDMQKSGDQSTGLGGKLHGLWQTISGGAGLVGAFSNLIGVIGGGAGRGGGGGFIGVLGSLGPAIVGAGALAAAFGVILLGPVLAGLFAVAASIGALALVAIPDFGQIWAAILKGPKAIDSLPGPMRAVGEQGYELRKSFEQIAKAVQPAVMTMFAAGLRVLKDLMPALKPLIEGAAKAFTSFFNEINRWLTSAAGQRFLHWLEVEGPQAMMRFTHALFDVMSVVGRVFSFLDHEGLTMDHTLSQNFDDIRHAWIDTGHAIEVAGDALGRAFMTMVDAVRRAISYAISAFETFGRAGMTLASSIGHATMDVIHFFASMDSQVIHLVSSLAGELYHIGQMIIAGLANGIRSMAGAVISAAESIVTSIPSKIASMLGLGSPSRITFQHGVWLAEGLINGMDSMRGQVLDAAERMAGAATLGSAATARAGSGAPGGQIVLDLTAGGNGLDHLFMTWLAGAIRAQGGDPRILVRKVKFT